MKTCFRCGNSYSEDFFRKDPKGRLRINSPCWNCNNDSAEKERNRSNARCKIWYQTNKEKVRADIRRVISSRKFKQKNKEKIRKYNKAYQQEHKQKRKQYYEKDKPKARARWRLAQAIRSKKIERKSACEFCGSIGKLHGHHQDYSKPLEVIWLCIACHKYIHQKHEVPMTLQISLEQKNKTIDYLKSIAKIAFESKQYQGMSEPSLLNLMLSAQDLGISALKAINGGFYIVNGKVCMSTSLMVDRIRRAGHSIQIKAMTREKCIIQATRKDNQDSLSYEYTWEDATLAGLTNSPTWKKYPKQMLYNRCMSNVARILFSDVVGNCYSEEERFDIQNVPAEERPLEDPEAAQVIEIEPEQIEAKTDDEQITEQQAAQIDFYLLEDKKAADRICKVYEIETVYDLKQKDFERVLGILEQRKQVILEKKNVKSA